MTGRRVGVLAVAAFVVASDATLVAALLRQVASTLSVSPAAAGQAVTAYAAGYALGAPLFIRAARRAPRERLLAGALGVFAAANAATAAAPSLAALLAARIGAGACGGVFIAAAAATAAGSAAPGRRGRALAMIVGGSSAGTALGVPLGTVAGGAVGWRPAFFAITALAALAAAAAAAFSPHQDSMPAPAPAAVQRGAVLLILATTLLWATGSFTFFTYISVILHRTASVSASGLAGFLLVFGLTGLAGVGASGWLTDKKGPLLALTGGLALTALSLAGFGVIAAAAASPPAVIASGAAIAGYGFGTWAITPPQQQRLLWTSGDEPLLLSLNSSALYAGVALGGAAGGLTLSISHSITAVCWTAAGIELAALTLAARAASRKNPQQPPSAQAMQPSTKTDELPTRPAHLGPPRPRSTTPAEGRITSREARSRPAPGSAGSPSPKTTTTRKPPAAEPKFADATPGSVFRCRRQACRGGVPSPA